MRRTGILPLGAVLDEIEVLGNNAVTGGGFADIWKGNFKGKQVALKVLRIFGENENEKKHLRVSLISPNLAPKLFL